MNEHLTETRSGISDIKSLLEEAQERKNTSVLRKMTSVNEHLTETRSGISDIKSQLQKRPRRGKSNSRSSYPAQTMIVLSIVLR